MLADPAPSVALKNDNSLKNFDQLLLGATEADATWLQ